ncbi:MAG: class I SAM-dependent methyltransferase [Desulfobacterales bacterium]|nr:class I SAM-dependent methyltransferase [Desulfobacterales bacterium]
MEKRKSTALKNFWQLAYSLRLYNLLVMSSYYESLRTIANKEVVKENNNIIDIGCGSGLILDHLSEKLLSTNSNYTGLELTSSGVSASRRRIKKLGIEKHANVYSADMCVEFPIKQNSMDIAIAHFSLYVLSSRENRILALKNITSVLKEDGVMLLALPATNYNAAQQVKSSIDIDQKSEMLPFYRKMYNRIMYQTLGRMSEMSIANKIKDGTWQGFTEDGILFETEAAGLKIEWIESTYGDTSYIIKCKKVIQF